ncbi:hypothetical protein BFP72_15545 [Reichenbachiella sp. 5M10]|uniref:hypothetical protein n=1 Tax=Reichenbachiella sp. 5M10 TaxID=1889772 RepID=UPI000C14B887|nr:hypothetical protein [Reichenbachiella sp. 5M10]PIB36712.1 hypothetical protein BFP72_15545 [Reichenbachiella sp. 5M10]
MIVPFDQMPESARVWIYQANKSFEPQDLRLIQEEATQFLTGWAAHGAPLKSAFKVLHDKFLILSVDESLNQASGCSIDASVGLVRNLAQKLNVDFFDRTQVCFILQDEIFESPISELKTHIENGKIKKDTLTFNHLVPTIQELNASWIVPAQDSWIKRYF